MNNLGGYQWLTTVAKKVGGPKKLVLLIAGSGAVIYKIAEIAFKKKAKSIKSLKTKDQALYTSDTTFYTITKEYFGADGLEFKFGDHFRILESDKDAILIEKDKDRNNPYFVSASLLEKISDYKCRRQ